MKALSIEKTESTFADLQKYSEEKRTPNEQEIVKEYLNAYQSHNTVVESN